MYAVKEAKYCGFTAAIIESEHGRFECLFKEKDNMDFHLSFNGEYYVISENETLSDMSWVKSSIAGVINRIEIFTWDDMAVSLEEYSELCKLCASAVAYLNN